MLLEEFDTITLKALLLMTNTTAGSENDGKTVTTDLTTLDEHDGSGYVQKTLSGIAISKDDTNDWAKLTASNVTWSSLGAGTRDVQGILIVHDVAAVLNLCFWLEYQGAREADGSDFVVEWRSDKGIAVVQ